MLRSKIILSVMFAIVFTVSNLSGATGRGIRSADYDDSGPNNTSDLPTCGENVVSTTEENSLAVYIAIDESTSMALHDPDTNRDQLARRHYVAEAILEFLHARRLASGTVNFIKVYRYPASGSGIIEQIPLNSEHASTIDQTTFDGFLEAIKSPPGNHNDTHILGDVLQHLLDEVAAGIRANSVEDENIQPVVILITDGSFVGPDEGLPELETALTGISERWQLHLSQIQTDLRNEGLQEVTVPIFTTLMDFDRTGTLSHTDIERAWRENFYAAFPNRVEDDGDTFIIRPGIDTQRRGDILARSDILGELSSVSVFQPPLGGNWDMAVYESSTTITHTRPIDVDEPLATLSLFILDSNRSLVGSGPIANTSIFSPSGDNIQLIQPIHSQTGIFTAKINDAPDGEWTVSQNTTDQNYNSLIFVSRINFNYDVEVSPIVPVVGQEVKIFPTILDSANGVWNFDGSVSGGNIDEPADLSFRYDSVSGRLYTSLPDQVINTAGNYVITMETEREDRSSIEYTCVLNVMDIPEISGSIDVRDGQWRINIDVTHTDLLRDTDYTFGVYMDDGCGVTQPLDIILGPPSWSGYTDLTFAEGNGKNIIAQLTVPTSNSAITVNDEWSAHLDAPEKVRPPWPCPKPPDICEFFPTHSFINLFFPIAILVTILFLLLALFRVSSNTAKYSFTKLLLMLLVLHIVFLGIALVVWKYDIQVVEATYGVYAIGLGALVWVLRSYGLIPNKKTSDKPDSGGNKADNVSGLALDENTVAVSDAIAKHRVQAGSSSDTLKKICSFLEPLWNVLIAILLTLCLLTWAALSWCDLQQFLEYLL